MFEGAHAAIVTPFQEGSNQIHEGQLTSLINWHIDSGLDGIVVSGTTGEAPALSPDEKKQLMELTVECVGERANVIAGTGTSSTRQTVELTKHAKRVGCDGALIVCPAYNKPNKEGVYEHFATVADETGFPIIMYDNPGRSAANIPAETATELSDLEPIKAIKEASGDLTHSMKLLEHSSLTLLSGSDSLTFPLLALGGKGVISVVANVCPEKTASMVHRYLDGDHEASRSLHEELFPLMDTLMSETNPIPVKAALSMMDRINPYLRKPLVKANEETKERLHHQLKHHHESLE